MRAKVIFRAAAVVIVLVVVALILLRIRASQDEGPIIVGNGSIEIRASDGEWKDGTSEWINQTSGTINKNELWVKVTSSAGTCRASGKPVHVQYSVPSVHVIFNTSGAWWWAKTRVTPRSDISFVNAKQLRAGTAGDGGHITEVRAQSQTCSLPAGAQNVAIAICSSADVPDCQ